MTRPPLVLGTRQMACWARCEAFAEREHELVYCRDHVVRARCLACGGTEGYALPLAVAGAVLLDTREASA